MPTMPDPGSTLTGVLDLRVTPDHAAALDEAVVLAREERWAERLFDRDTTLWSQDERVQVAIADRLVERGCVVGGDAEIEDAGQGGAGVGHGWHGSPC